MFCMHFMLKIPLHLRTSACMLLSVGCPLCILRKDEAMKSLSTTQPAEELVSRQEKQQSVRKVRSRSRKNALTFWSFVLPLLLGITVFFYIPIIWSVVLSFSTARA